jgi:signal transduction histidine kinase
MMNDKLIVHQTMLEKSRDRIKRFSGKILSVREEEMKRLGRDLHDMVGSMAVSLSAKLTVAEGKVKDRNIDGALKDLHQTKRLLESIVGSFKKIAVSLRPPQLETVGLSGALKEYCHETSKLADLPIKMDINIDNDLKIPEDLAIALFRVVQESLTNVIKHANARHFSVHMSERDSKISLVIMDDGVGFNSKDSDLSSQKLKMGILGMRERIESFGGEFFIESQYGKGTKIRIIVSFKDNLV